MAGSDMAPPLQAVVTSALDRAPDHVAILDASGHIVWVNQAWIDFGVANGARVDSWIGRDYLDPPCVDDDLDDDADELLGLIRSVVDGSHPERTAEYPCPSPTEPRWFSLDAWSFEADGKRFVIVAHHNITPHYLAERRALELAHTDTLTGLANRRQFESFLSRHWFHAMRYDMPVSLLAIDVDEFKGFNDEFGHETGDRILRQLAAAIESVCRRNTDLAARIGGDEFAALLTGIDADIAVDLAHRLRTTFSANCRRHLGFDTAVSVGVATMRPTEGDAHADLVRLADRCLLEAKRRGRDRVVSEAPS